jgi:mannitol/fructose-specific phosphotransferase system IIA component (Ntr-type)
MNTARSASAENDEVELLGFLGPDSVVTLPGGLAKEEVLAFMVETLASKGRLPVPLVPKVIAALQQREKLGTTGLGRGLALPHMRTEGITEFIGLVGVATEGIDFDSLDGSPTRVVILVISPFDQRERHIQTLGRLATLLSSKTLQYSMQIPRSPESLLRLLGIEGRKPSSQ